jgi:hypothetical protein
MSDKDIDYRASLMIQTDFSDALDVTDLELVNMRRVSPLFARQIADKGILLYEDRRGRFVDFRVMTFKLYVETAPLRRLRENYLTNFLKAHAY